jgi:hypothetical protein
LVDEDALSQRLVELNLGRVLQIDVGATAAALPNDLDRDLGGRLAYFNVLEVEAMRIAANHLTTSVSPSADTLSSPHGTVSSDPSETSLTRANTMTARPPTRIAKATGARTLSP